MRGLLFISPWLIGFLAFSVYPLVATAIFSLTDYSVLSRPVFIGAGNFQDLMTDPIFWQALSNTLVFAVLAVPLNTVVACFLAVLLNFNVRGRGIYRTVFFLPSLVPMVCLALVWRWLLNGELGLINIGARPDPGGHQRHLRDLFPSAQLAAGCALHQAGTGPGRTLGGRPRHGHLPGRAPGSAARAV